MKSILPQFSKIKPKSIKIALDKILSDNRKSIKNISEQESIANWNTVLKPLEECSEKLHSYWAQIELLNAVNNNKELRKVYNDCLPKISAYFTELGQNEKIYQQIKVISKSEEYNKLSEPQKKIIQNELRDFKLSGIELSNAQKKLFKETQQQLSKLGNKFSNNLLDATNRWSKHITDKKELSGIPDYAVQAAANAANKKHKKRLDSYIRAA